MDWSVFAAFISGLNAGVVLGLHFGRRERRDLRTAPPLRNVDRRAREGCGRSARFVFGRFGMPTTCSRLLQLPGEHCACWPSSCCWCGQTPPPNEERAA